MPKKDQIAARQGLGPWLQSHQVSETRFYPGPVVWLNNRRWEDEVVTTKTNGIERSKGWAYPDLDEFTPEYRAANPDPFADE